MTPILMSISYYLTGRITLDLIIVALLLFILFIKILYASSLAVHDREIKNHLTPQKFVHRYVAKHYPYITSRREKHLIKAVLRIYDELSTEQAWFIYDDAVATFQNKESF